MTPLFPSLVPLPPRANIEPLIRFVGSKRWLVPFLDRGIWWRLGRYGGRYIEPFAGGASVGLAVGWPAAILGDASSHLIEMYRSVSSAWEDVAAELWKLVGRYGAESGAGGYYAVREAYNELPKRTNGGGGGGEDGTDPIQAARLLYLIARGFNGVFRVNRGGGFNVPVGDVKNPRFCDPARLEAFSAATSTWDWRCADFAETIAGACAHDVLFCDPPYAGTFGAYTAGGFAWTDQVRLADVLQSAAGRGAYVLHTNADTPEIRALHESRGFYVLTTAERRAVNRDAKGRARVGCILTTNAPELVL